MSGLKENTQVKRRKSNSKRTLFLFYVILSFNVAFAVKPSSIQGGGSSNYNVVTRQDLRKKVFLPVHTNNNSTVSGPSFGEVNVLLVKTVQPRKIRKVLTEVNGMLVYKNARQQTNSQKKYGHTPNKAKLSRRQTGRLSSPSKWVQRISRKSIAGKRRLKYLRPRLRVARPHVGLAKSKRTQPYSPNVYKSRAKVQVRQKLKNSANNRRSIVVMRRQPSIRKRNKLSVKKRLRPFTASRPISVEVSRPINHKFVSSHTIHRQNRLDRNITKPFTPVRIPPSSNINENLTAVPSVVDRNVNNSRNVKPYNQRNLLKPVKRIDHGRSSTSLQTAVRRSRNFTDLSWNNLTGWWAGDNVCVEEKPGLFSRKQKLLQRLQTEKHCSERKNKFICVVTYNIGGRIPVSSTSYHCCPGYTVSTDRERCEENTYYQETESFEQGSLLVNRINFPSSPITRSAPDGKVLTIFMPSDDVIEKAFLPEDGPQNLIEVTAVKSFFENHLILNQKILSSQMNNNQVFTAFSGNPIRINFFPSSANEVITANCQKVSVVDEVNGDSIVHYIDGVLHRVSDTIYDYLLRNKEEFSSLIQALRSTGMSKQLRSSSRAFTLFAPTNEAFDAVALSTGSSDCLQAVIQNLVIEDVICSEAANGNNRTIRTTNQNTLTLHRIGDVTYVNDAVVTRPDVMATNGVVHKIDRVLKSSSVNSMLEILSNQHQLSTMVNLFQIAGIKNALATGTNFTLIVPTNKAFKKTPRSSLLRLTTYVEDLRSVLMFHLIPEEVNWKQLKTNKRLETLNPPNDIHINRYLMKVRSRGKKRYVQKTATSLQCARILGQPRSLPCNGAMYFVDKVLTPPIGSLLTTLMYPKNNNFSTFIMAVRRSGLERLFDGSRTLTLFAPSNRIFERIPKHVTQRLLGNKALLIKLIKFHLIPGYHCEHELLQQPSKRKTLLRSSFISCPKRGRIYLGRRKKRLRAKVIESNIEATNGVIHAIDNILLPRKFKIF